MTRDWTNMNNDILGLIFGKVRTLEDFTRLGVVCSNWRSVLMKHQGPPQLPWLILPCDHAHDNAGHPCQSQCQSRRTFSIMEENKVRHLYFPEAFGKKCVGSSHGWLIMVEDVSPAIFMLNPLTKERIELPPVTTMPEILGFNREEVGREYIYLNVLDGKTGRMGLKDIEDFFTYKIILSHNPKEEDCIAVAICGQLCRLVFCRIGDNKWTQVENASKSPQNDVVYSKGKFYVINCQAMVGVFDVRNPQVNIIHKTPSGINKNHEMYLAVDTSGALLLISRWVHIYDILTEAGDNADFDNNYFYQTKKFNVFKLDEEKNEWNKVRDIGENIVFLGDNQSICYSTVQFPECKRNNIYFTDGEGQRGLYQGHDVGIFNIEDGSIRNVPCFKEDISLRTIFPPPVWFTPALRSA